MSAFSTFSTTASVNTLLGSINIAEGCPAANVNDALRSILAEGRGLYDLYAGINVSSYMPLSGGHFTGPVYQIGAGSYTVWASPSLTSGLMYVQPTATALPSSPGEGTIVYQY